MASTDVDAAKGVPDHIAFLTPASSASLLDELEYCASRVSAPSHSAVFGDNQHTFRQRETVKDARSDGTPSPLPPPNTVFSREAEWTRRRRQRYRAANQPKTAMTPDTPPKSMSRAAAEVDLATGGSAFSRCTASILESRLGTVEQQDPHRAALDGKRTKRSSSIVKARRDHTPDSERPDMTPSWEPSSKTQRAWVGKKHRAPAVAEPIDSVHRERPPTGGGPSAQEPLSPRDGQQWMRRPTPTSAQTKRWCPGRLAVSFSCSLAQDKTRVGSSSARRESSVLPCRPVKCASTSSTSYTMNSESHHEIGWEGKPEELRRADSHDPCPEVGGCPAEDKKKADEHTSAYDTGVQCRHPIGGQSVLCAGKASGASLESEHLSRPIRAQWAARRSSSLDSIKMTAVAGKNTKVATEKCTQEGKSRSGQRPDVFSRSATIPSEMPSVFPTVASHAPPLAGRVLKQDFDQNIRLRTLPGERTKSTLTGCIISVPWGRRGCVPPEEYAALKSAIHSASSAPGSDGSIKGGRLSTDNTSRALLLYSSTAESDTCDPGAAEENDIRNSGVTEGRTTQYTNPNLASSQCVLQPSSVVALPQLLKGKNASVESSFKEPRRICTAGPLHSSHLRKAHRYMDCGECVSSPSEFETSTFASVTTSGQAASAAHCVAHEQPGDQALMHDAVIHLKKSNALSNSGITKASTTSGQRATVVRSPNSLLRVSTPKRDLPFRTPLKGEEVVKYDGDRLSILERVEILNYETVWYWGAERVTHPDEVQNCGGCNFGFDDARGDYRAILGDHICYRFELMTPLGRGSFGQVFRAFDHKNREHVALKIVRNKNHFHIQGRIEIDVLQELLQHDAENKANVIHMKEHFLFRDHLVITFELLSVNVYEFLRQNSFKGLSSLAVRSIAIQLLKALRLLRKLRIIHCDLKPENIMLKNVHKSGVKIIDFGSSCREGETPYSYIQSRFYRSPEVILGLTYDCAIDMWSLGCVLAELHTGHPLFPGENEADQISCIIEVLGPPPSKLISQSPKKQMFFGINGEVNNSTSPHGNRRKAFSSNFRSVLHRGGSHFADFIRGCLQWDAARRMTPEEAMQHHWIKEFRALRPRNRLLLNN